MTELTKKDWRDFSYYPIDNHPCCVCGSTTQIGMEPRFLYYVCEEHSKLSPVEIGQIEAKNRKQ